ncbi:MAG TPA: cupin domain-containing protein [Anaerolineae bacterium]|nr:cupin domain-containing protein [Anaerolineae bacterium]
MTIYHYGDMPVQRLRAGAERRLARTDHLMIVVVDLDDGPRDRPDIPHAHPHEQASYVAEGEVLFFMAGRSTHLVPGDVYLVPSGEPHAIQQLTAHVRLIDCFTPVREDFLQEGTS